MTTFRLGGISGDKMADAAVTLPMNSSSYPSSRMALISIAPRPPASAVEVPDIPPNTMLAKMLTMAMPPGSQPTILRAKLKILVVIPPSFIILPVNRNIGRANSVKLFRALIVPNETEIILNPPFVIAKVSTEARPSDGITGMLNSISTTISRKQ